MAGYFFDTNALVKRYYPETGTETVDMIAALPGARILIFRLPGAELMSAFAIKVRTRTIDISDGESLDRQFRADVMAGRLSFIRLRNRSSRSQNSLYGAMQSTDVFVRWMPYSWRRRLERRRQERHDELSI